MTPIQLRGVVLLSQHIFHPLQVNIPACQETDDAGMENTLIIEECVEQQVFESANKIKSQGPDNIGVRVLKRYSVQLSGIFYSLFRGSLNIQVVPSLWKTSMPFPLPKVTHPPSSNDYKPSSLTSLIVKSPERFIKTHIIN